MTLHAAVPIAAIATAPGRGAVGVVRVSGHGLQTWAHALLGRLPQPRVATLMSFTDAQGLALDQGLALWFPAPHSYTGEDILELQAHGGPVVLQLLLARCLEVAQSLQMPMRLAQPGEFSQRAFLNDKIDLAQAEAVADLIDASTEAAARGAARSLMGEFSQRVDTLLQALTNLRMLVEATLDFPDEEIDFLQRDDAHGQLRRLTDQVRELLSQAQQGALLREGMTVVIAGQPNAGKSSLLNALAGAELAIVTPIAGTTRDVVQQTIQIHGVPVHVLDTAGLRESEDVVERIGIERAWREIEKADAVVFLHDVSQWHDERVRQADADVLSRLPNRLPVLHVWNKIDIGSQADLPVTEHDLRLSAKTHEGLDRLREELIALAGWRPAGEGLLMARQRHVHALQVVAEHLQLADGFLQTDAMQLDLLAEELRLAQVALSEITGAMTADDLLGEIFSSFCIGK